MAPTTGLGDNLYVGSANLSGDIGSLSKISTSLKPLVDTGINKFGVERLPGPRDGEIDFTAWFNPAAGQEHVTLKALPLTDVPVSYFRGTAIGNPVASCWAKQIDYKGKRGTDGSLSFDVNAMANAFGLEWGVQLTAGVRTDTVATNGTAADSGAFSSFDAQAYLHVFAFTGTSITVTIQDSPDNVTFTDVFNGGFPVVSGLTFSRMPSLTSGGTLNRYTRVRTSGTFSNAQFAVAMMRNQVATVF